MKIKYQVYLSPKLSDYLKDLVAQEDSTYSEAIAQIIREHKANKEKEERDNDQERPNKRDIRANGK